MYDDIMIKLNIGFYFKKKDIKIQCIFELDKKVVGMIALDLEDDDKTVGSNKMVLLVLHLYLYYWIIEVKVMQNCLINM